MRGMTLLELMVVVAMMGVLTTLAIGLSSKTGEAQKNFASARSVTHALLEIRNWAHNTSRCVQVEATSTGLTATPYDSCDPDLSGEASSLTRLFAFPAILHDFAFDTLSGTLVFNENGGTTESEITTLSFVNESTGETHHLLVYPAIGSVRDETP